MNEEKQDNMIIIIIIIIIVIIVNIIIFIFIIIIIITNKRSQDSTFVSNSSTAFADPQTNVHTKTQDRSLKRVGPGDKRR